MSTLGLFSLVFIAFSVVAQGKHVTYTQPQQVHLSYGASPAEVMVTWVTFSPTNVSTVEYGPWVFEQRVRGTVTEFKVARRTLFVHRVLLTKLVPGTYYHYHCGSSDGWSAHYVFHTLPLGPRPPKVAVFGDMGNANARSLGYLQEQVQAGDIDVALHIGDFAYDMDSDEGRVGDEFMRQIETIAAYVPYMTCVGNHEEAENFTHYDKRFSMMDQDGNANNFFYSFDVGPAHIIELSSEFYFFLEYGWRQAASQYDWLVKDLKKANLPENRKQRPWIIVAAHRPMYCTGFFDRDCSNSNSVMRKGFPLSHAFGLEDLLYENGVDLYFAGHQHSYERLWPTYNNKVYNGSYEQPYVNPRATVHVVTGAAGCDEGLSPFMEIPQAWSAKRILDYGYMSMTLLNGTHVALEQISTSNPGQVVDAVTLVKDGPYPAWYQREDGNQVNIPTKQNYWRSS
ncbi:acid phosphatase type 7-like [Ornithodoros turicata]|uniref:acid phosphatase type 7-like n=1 Tax=Ornithodoros turicata TaxID=34597 RepID=UPI003139AFD0